MPTLSPPAKVLVTGANGYIAIWLVKALLEKGYSVRGTVRSAEKGAHLKELFKAYGDKHEVVVVEDITKEGAFDEAVKGVDAIEHTASPFHLKADDPDELIIPAVKGTVGVLQSALKNGSSIKRIVITSSCAAVLRASPSPLTFSETDWNDDAIAHTQREGRAAPNMVKYRASKTLAEKAAWEFVEKNKGEVGWDLVVVNPPYVFGPVLHLVSSPSSLNTSVLDWYHTVLHPPTDLARLKTGSCWIDVRDLAEAHVRAIEKSEAGGERVIVSAGPFVWQDWIDVANTLTPPPLGAYALPKGTPGAGKNAVHQIVYDTRKAARVLGLSKYRSMEECTRDSLSDFGGRGWVN